MRRWLSSTGLGVAVLIGLPLVSLAAPAPSATVAPPSTGATPRPLSTEEQSAPMPPGHPAVGNDTIPPGHPNMGDDDDGGDDLPPGHPATGNPGGSPGRPGMPAQNSSRPDPTLPRGTIAVDVKNGVDGTPMPGVDVILGSVASSIAKGDMHKRLTATSQANGEARFSNLETASNIAYRLSIVRDGATYAAPPFQLSGGGMRTTLNVFPVTTDSKAAQFAAQGLAYVELRDEVISVEVVYRVFNIGNVTWIPTNTTINLPAGFKAFSAQKSMSDVGFDAADSGARFRGTISPGAHDASFRFQIPFDGNDEMEIDLGLLPNVQMFRVMSEAPRGMTVEVPGFPPAEPSTNNNGQRILVTERESARPDPTFQRVRVRLHNLPTRPAGRWVAVSLALASVAGGLAYVYAPKPKPKKGSKKGSKKDETRENSPLDPQTVERTRQQILDDIRKLDEAFARDEIGPKTYERERRLAIDALAQLIVSAESSGIEITAKAVDNPGDKLPAGS